jgi:hypothetical protein
MSHPLLDHFASQSDRRATVKSTSLRLNTGESRVLPRSVRRFRVLAGKAWVALDTEDVIVRYQETLHLRNRHSPAIVTPLGSEGLELEIIA